MSFKLTYSTMFDPPPELHTRFDVAMARVSEKLGASHALHTAGEDRQTCNAALGRNPADQEQVLGEFATATVEDTDDAMQAAQRSWQSWRQTAPSERMRLLRRVGALIEERVFDIAAALTLEVGKNRMEGLGEAQETADFFNDHPLTAGVTFTSSYEVGMRIGRTLQAGRYPRPYIAEMGGKNACIVTASADLDCAAAGIVRSAFGMGGQKCSALSRLYAHREIADALLERIARQTAALAMGNPALQKNWLGPLTTRSEYDSYARRTEQLSTADARMLIRGECLEEGDLAQGFFVRPVVAEAPLDHPLWRTELFLPILMLHRMSSSEEAMQLANQSAFGLTAGFYGARDEIPWFHEHIEAGVTYANRPQGATTGAWPGYQPFAGWKGSGNTGKAIASFYYLPQYLREQSQTVVE